MAKTDPAVVEAAENWSEDVRALAVKAGQLPESPPVLLPGVSTGTKAPAGGKIPRASTHHARTTWSELCGRRFDSKAEAERGEELRLMELAGEIDSLKYQETFILSEEPKVTITIDFKYKKMTGSREYVREDVKGWTVTKKRRTPKPRIERDFRVKLAWLREKYGIEVKLIK